MVSNRRASVKGAPNQARTVELSPAAKLMHRPTPSKPSQRADHVPEAHSPPSRHQGQASAIQVIRPSRRRLERSYKEDLQGCCSDHHVSFFRLISFLAHRLETLWKGIESESPSRGPDSDHFVSPCGRLCHTLDSPAKANTIRFRHQSFRLHIANALLKWALRYESLLGPHLALTSSWRRSAVATT
jgi:hypothetical protein